MEDFKRILVAVDGSKSSEKALDVAILLAMAKGAALDVLYVSYFQSKTDSEDVSWLPESVTRPTGQVKEDILARVATKADGLVAYELHERTGVPAEEIIRFSREHDDEPIVVGGRGLSRLEGFFLGSCSQEVMEKATGTVLLVK